MKLLDCTMSSCRKFALNFYSFLPFSGTLRDFKGFHLVSIFVSLCDLGVELYTQDLVKLLRRRLFQDIFFQMAGSGLAPASEDVHNISTIYQPSVPNLKVYMTDFFYFARSNLPNVLISTAKKFFP